ncbi:MAG: glycosyltransferase, partial [Kiritimatiellia bacterium]
KLLPGVAARILAAMRRAGHIHLRCPSNVGLIGLALQAFFPNKPKTIKYAGNWQSYPGEPWSYRLQKCLARNSVWCRRSRILAYGPSHSDGSHVVSAFAATHHEADARIPVSPRTLSREQEIRFLFVGTLAPNTRPLLAVEACQRLRAGGIPARLDLFGDGPERQKVETLIRSCKAGDAIHCYGNLPLEVLTVPEESFSSDAFRIRGMAEGGDRRYVLGHGTHCHAGIVCADDSRAW